MLCFHWGSLGVHLCHFKLTLVITVTGYKIDQDVFADLLCYSFFCFADKKTPPCSLEDSVSVRNTSCVCLLALVIYNDGRMSLFI